MPHGITIAVPSSATEQELGAVDQGLGRFNEQHKALNDVRVLHVIASDELGSTVGGAVGRTWGACCELQQLWVNPAHRRSAIGRGLMEVFEGEARNRACTLIYLETFSFQAPEFYEKCGFHRALVIRGFTQEVVKFIMQKPLSAGGDA
jgi:GNAT superfamily N-acetyltransferase